MVAATDDYLVVTIYYLAPPARGSYHSGHPQNPTARGSYMFLSCGASSKLRAFVFVLPLQGGTRRHGQYGQHLFDPIIAGAISRCQRFALP